jgi:phage terminase Nu1 subunit (DNA packaging protein)
VVVVRRALKLKAGAAAYRALPEAERLALLAEALKEALKDSRRRIASVGAASLLKRRFKRVTPRDVEVLVEDVRERLRAVNVDGAEWRFAGARRSSKGRKLVFVRSAPSGERP